MKIFIRYIPNNPAIDSTAYINPETWAHVSWRQTYAMFAETEYAGYAGLNFD